MSPVSRRWKAVVGAAGVALVLALGLGLGRGRGLGARAAGVASVLGLEPRQAGIKRPASNHVEVRGTNAMLGFAQRVAERYMEEHPGAIITAAGGGATRGVKSVVVGTADIGLISGDIPEELDKLAKLAKVNLKKEAVYRDVVYVLVNPKNRVNNLTISEVRDIFSGKKTNWNEVGGVDAKIVVINQEVHTGAFETLKRVVLKETTVVTHTAKTVASRDFPRAMREDEHAIGYEGQPLGLKPVSIDGVTASSETLGSSKYPIQRTLSIVYRQDAPPAVADLVGYFLAPDKGQALLNPGDVPVNPPAQPAK